MISRSSSCSEQQLLLLADNDLESDVTLLDSCSASQQVWGNDCSTAVVQMCAELWPRCI